MDHLHEEEGKGQVPLNPKRHDGHLHAEEVEDQNPPKRHGGHLQAEEGEYIVQLLTEHMVITCMEKKVKIQVQLNPERQGDHMHAEEGEHQIQLNAGSHGGHLHAEGSARVGSSGSMQHYVSF